MKRTTGWISALLTAILLQSVFAAPAAGVSVSVYIPDSSRKLDIPFPGVFEYEGDPFLTGVYGAETSVVWNDAETGDEQRCIRTVATAYPEGSFGIRKIVAEYGSDKRRSLVRYTIICQYFSNEYYTFSYDGDTDKMTEGYYTDGDIRLATGVKGDFDHWYIYDIVKCEYIRIDKNGVYPPSVFKKPRI